MGCMRLPVKNGSPADIDTEQTADMIRLAFDRGINYFDTAWPYHMGNSEQVVGSILAKYPRSSYYLATKFPGMVPEHFSRIEEIFADQLNRTQAGYFDFYMLHCVCEADVGLYCAHAPELKAFLLKQKEAGIIRHLGFSVHGTPAVIEQILNAYGDMIEFCQIQLNWFDWEFIAAKDNVRYLNDRNIPVWVMEPVRGGRLSSLPPAVEELRKERFPDESASQTAMRFLQQVPGVTVVLTGASTLTQLEENIQAFSGDNEMTQEDAAWLTSLGPQFSFGVPCTRCGYCLAACPSELDIPKILSLYNEDQFTGNGFITIMGVSALAPEKRPFACTRCQTCESVCPQEIHISEIMTAFSKTLRSNPDIRNPFKK